MGLSREEAIDKVNKLPNDASRKNQNAIVKLMNDIGGIERKVHEIPGGKNLTEYEDEESLPVAVFTWLRMFPSFERFELSLIGDYGSYEDIGSLGLKASKIKVEDFAKSDGKKPWELKGFRTVADLIAKYVSSEKRRTLAVILEKDGIYQIYDSSNTFSPEHEAWTPTLIVHRIKKH